MIFHNDDIRFYELDNDYVEYLYHIESQVYYHESYRTDIKPYVGIMVTENDIDYFSPLTSAKPKHSSRPLHSRDYITIYEIVDKNIKEQDAIYCKSVQDCIIKNATKLYTKTLNKDRAISKFHCDYLKLEKAMEQYKFAQ